MSGALRAAPRKPARRSAPRRKPAPPDKDAGAAAAQVRAYLAGQPPVARRQLRKLRETILAVAPGAVEAFSYRIPAFRLEGRPLVWYAAFTEHCSLFPMTAAIRKTLAVDLEGYETSKGTVRFALAKPLPVSLVRKLVRARVADVGSARRRGAQVAGRRAPKRRGPLAG